MAHDPSSRAAVQNLLAESDVAPSEELTRALSDLSSVGRREAPPISPELAAVMRQASSAPGDNISATPSRTTGESNVIPLRRGRKASRGAAMGGAVVLAMAAGIGGVAAFGPDNSVESAVESVLRWVAPADAPEPASDDQPAKPAPAPAQVTPDSVPTPAQPTGPVVTEVPTEVPVERTAPEPGRALPSPTQDRPTPQDAGKPEKKVVPRVELPELPVPVPDPGTGNRPELPIDTPELPVPGGIGTTAPTPDPALRQSR
ncbi:hypothetical protein GC088_01285 [Arthrobacter sp. JZ12]|uniref:hypothetical protein n=1 Tax=Arthrobacter sp. JZ12 TaxID=2654190 RepID=UPI002B488506|nr:hypothetical protein [Arthrobacter sp. JZ12]WRH23886.1 hypothetical protein GC088_01285 [Arthrobacter sp. JZ12]